MYVRLAFAVAAHLEPEILLVDEVLAVGDATYQIRCINRMHEIARSGRSVLFVSHNMDLIPKLCERAILLNKGRVVRSGKAGEVVDAYISEVANSAEDEDLTGREHNGDGRARFEGLAILDDSGMPAPAVYCGRDLRCVVDIRLRPSIKNVSLTAD